MDVSLNSLVYFDYQFYNKKLSPYLKSKWVTITLLAVGVFGVLSCIYYLNKKNKKPKRFVDNPLLIKNLTTKVFSFLDVSDLVRMEQVGKLWKECAEADLLWEPLINPLFKEKTKAQFISRYVFSFGYYHPKKHQIAAKIDEKEGVKKISKEEIRADIDKMIKTIPQSYTSLCYGMGRYDIIYHLDGSFGVLDSEDVKYLPAKTRLMEEISKKCHFIETDDF